MCNISTWLQDLISSKVVNKDIQVINQVHSRGERKRVQSDSLRALRTILLLPLKPC